MMGVGFILKMLSTLRFSIRCSTSVSLLLCSLLLFCVVIPKATVVVVERIIKSAARAVFVLFFFPCLDGVVLFVCVLHLFGLKLCAVLWSDKLFVHVSVVHVVWLRRWLCNCRYTVC